MLNFFFLCVYPHEYSAPNEPILLNNVSKDHKFCLIKIIKIAIFEIVKFEKFFTFLLKTKITFNI